MRRWRRCLLIVLAGLLALGGGYAGLAASTSRSQLARAVLWGESDVGDHTRFPARRIAAGPTPFSFHRPAGGGVPPLRTVEVFENNRPVERGLEQFLVASDTTAFLILRGDTLLYEGYFNGAGHDATQTSMSVAKSALGALVGIAIGQGRIRSVDDPITVYVPELRKLALEGTEVVEEPGRRFHYNNFNPLLVGLALERAVGMPVAAYLEPGRPGQRVREDGERPEWAGRRLRQARRALRQRRHLAGPAAGPTRLGEGLNRRPHDRRRLHPRARVRLLLVGRGRPQPAGVLGQGRYGQHIYVVPESRLVLVRFGRDAGGQRWPQLLGDLAGRLALRRQGEGRRHGPPQRG